MNNVTQKELGLVIVASLLSVLQFGAFVLLLPLALTQVGVVVVLVALSLLWLALMAMAFAMVHSVWSRAVLVLLPALVMVVLSAFSAVALGAAALLTVFLLLAERTVAREIYNRVYFKTAQIFSGGLRLLGLGLMIALTGLAWPQLTESVATSRFEITARQVAPLLRPLEPLLRDYLPGYRQEATIDQLVTANIEQEKEQLPPGVIIDERALERTRSSLGQTFGTPLSGQENLADVVAATINRRAHDLTAQNPVIAAVILVILVFLTLRTLLPFVVWPVLGLMAGIFWVLQTIGFLKVQRTQAMIERIEL